MTEERRRTPRVTVMDSVRGHRRPTGEPVTLREIGLGGMSVETANAFDPAGVYDFILELGDGSKLDLRGRVAHSRAVTMPGGTETYLTGFEFVEADADGVGQLIDGVR